MKKRWTKIILYAVCFALFLVCGCSRRNGSAGSSQGDSATTKAFQEYQRQQLIDTLKNDKLSAHYTVKDLAAYDLDIPADLGSPLDSMEETEQQLQTSLDQLHEIDRDKLSTSDQNLYDRYESYLEKQIDYIGYEDYQYYFTPSSGVNNGILTNFTEYVIREEQDIQDMLAYISQSEQYLKDAVEVTKQQADRGFRQDKDTVQSILDQLNRFIDSDGSEVIKAVGAQIDEADYLSDQQKTDYKDQLNQEVADLLVPGFEAVRDYYTEALKNAPETNTLGSTEEGKKYYTVLLHDKTSTDMDPQDMKEALQDHIDQEMMELQMLYYQDPDAYIQGDPDFGYDKPEDILSHIREAMKDDFPAEADVGYTIDYLDPSVAPASVAAYYVNPPIDDVKDNVIKVNPSASNDLYPTLAHEGYPGHCYQITYQFVNHPSEFNGLMSFLGFTEGWAVYVERIALDYSQIKNPDSIEMYWLNTNVFYEIMSVVDIMVGYEGASVQDVQDYVSQYYSGSDIGESLFTLSEGDPGEYLPYGCGYMMMDMLREQTEKKLGRKFDLQAYHKLILDTGDCTFEYLEQQINQWVKTQK